MNRKSRHSKRNARGGFTLVEVMVSSFLTLIVLGMLFSVLVGTLDAWEAGTSNLQSSGDARLAMDVMRTDLESLVARQTSFNQEWLFSGPYHLDGSGDFSFGPHPQGGPTYTWLTFFAPSLDRDRGQAGDIVALSYRVAFQDPISPVANHNPMFGLYKAMTTTAEAFNNVMDFPPRALLVTDTANWSEGYWTNNPNPSVTDPSGFLAQYVVGFEITWMVRPAGGGGLVRVDKRHYVRLSNILEVYHFNDGLRTDLIGGKIEAAEVTMTLLTDEGARQFTLFQDAAQLTPARTNQIIADHGRTHTMRVPIHY